MSSNEVTRIISRSINPGHEKDYDDWLRRYLEFERRARGYLGTTLIMPGGSSFNIRYIIHRFRNKDAMDEWEKSEQALKLLEEVNNYSKRHYETASGMETWFTLPDYKTVIAPPKWKMAIVAFIAAYATSALSRSICLLS